MVGRPASTLAVRCVVSRSGRAICENLQLSSPTAITGATSVTARLPPQRSKSMRGRHHNHRRFEVPAANGSRPIVAGRLRGDKVSELFRTGEWICRRSNCRRETFDRLLLFGWLLPQRDPIGLSCEGVMRQAGGALRRLRRGIAFQRDGHWYEFPSPQRLSAAQIVSIDIGTARPVVPTIGEP
jgi:hypothetical protein